MWIPISNWTNLGYLFRFSDCNKPWCVSYIFLLYNILYEYLTLIRIHVYTCIAKNSIDMHFKNVNPLRGLGVVNHFPTPEFQLQGVHSQLITYQSKFAFFVLITIFVFKDFELNTVGKSAKLILEWCFVFPFCFVQTENSRQLVVFG